MSHILLVNHCRLERMPYPQENEYFLMLLCLTRHSCLCNFADFHWELFVEYGMEPEYK